MGSEPRSGPSVVPVGILLALSLALAMQVSCGEGRGSGHKPEVPATQAALPVPACAGPSSPLTPPWHLTEETAQARVYVDLSLSMAGFGRAPGDPLHLLLVQLKGILSGSSVSDLHGAGFAVAVDPVRPLQGLVDVLGWKPQGKNTCLAAPIAGEIAAADASDALLLVLTDGVPSATGATCGQRCAAGSDVVCVAEELIRYVEHDGGRALWVVGLRLPFKGHYWPELCPGSNISALPGTRRPIYIWVGASHLEAGRAVVAQLIAWAQGQQHEVIGFEVWPGRWQGLQPGKGSGANWKAGDFAASPAVTAQCKPTLRLSSVGKPDAVPPHVRLQRASSGGSVWAMRVPGIDLGDAAAPVPPLLKLAMGPVEIQNGQQKPLKTLPAGAASKVKGSMELCLAVTGNPVRVSVGWEVKTALTQLTNWTTNDDCRSKMLDRTLNLESMWTLVANNLAKEAKASLATTLACASLNPVAGPRER